MEPYYALEKNSAVRADPKITQKSLSRIKAKHLNCPPEYMQMLITRPTSLQAHR